MQTKLADFIKDTPDGREADAILRKCVHCGFCTATCPTYQLLGDELDGPRGRIYLMKQVLEGAAGHATKRSSISTAASRAARARRRVLRACTTAACSTSGGDVVEAACGARPADALARTALRKVVTRPALFEPLLRLGQLARPLLPANAARARCRRGDAAREPLPATVARAPHARARRLRAADALAGDERRCRARARPARHQRSSPRRAPAAAAPCRFTSTRDDEALDFMRRNIDAWWPHVEHGVEAIVITASGCGVMVKDYGHQLARDPRIRGESRARLGARERHQRSHPRASRRSSQSLIAASRSPVPRRSRFPRRRARSSTA